jgi:predicted O-methyltransferase YrrM
MFTRNQLEQLAVSTNRKVDTEELETLINKQEDASLISPGVAAHYYRFLYRLAQLMQPKVKLELGTHTGISAACLAEGCPKAKVITVDIDDVVRKEHRRPNVTYLHHDSLQKVDLPGKIDILFLDTFHDGIRPMNEYKLYEADVADGGMIFFDDIYLLECMKVFWSVLSPVRGEKFDLPVHSSAGFGAILINQ